MPRVKTDEKLEEILEASTQVFSGKDFHEVLIDEIAEAGGIGKGTVYRYFRTKEELYQATIEHGLAKLDKVLCDALPEEGSPTERLARLAREILAFYWDKRSLLMLLYRDERMVRGRQGVLRERHDRLAAHVQAILLEGTEGCEYRELDPHTTAELFLGMIRGINVFRRDGDTLDELVAEIVGVFTKGIARADA